jgi:TPP-dependent pyruvate/acetoin dehydrogenase alpha subunit
VDRGLLEQKDVDRMNTEAEKKVDDAVAFAEASPEPAPEDALTDVYVAYR